MDKINNYNLLLYRNIKIPVQFKSSEEHDADAIAVAKKSYMSAFYKKLGPADFYIYKKSVDARSKDNIYFIYTVAVTSQSISSLSETRVSKKSQFELINVSTPEIKPVSVKSNVIVAGFGPAGMFCAYALALAGLNPVVVERGSDIDTRWWKVENYWKTGKLDTETNVQFGEGGAGTFSDGKLLTRISDPLCGYVLKLLNKFGAPDEILYLAKPHIGTDLLRDVVKNIRREIIRLGGKILFDSKLTSVKRESAGRIVSVCINNSYDMPCDALFLCIGHSARDTFSMLMNENISISPKPFSVGLRVEHLQKSISDSLYGKYSECEALEKGQYTLSAKNNNRGVYSFCMCPGGVVVASASAEDEIVTNGMSYYKRDGLNANSAIAVSVEPSDYGNTVKGAIEFQKHIENNAFIEAGSNGAAPIQLLGDFLNDNDKFTEPHNVIPTYTGKTKLCKISNVLPEFVTHMIKFGFNQFEKQISGFSCYDAVLTAPETRTSSPVRIERTDERVSVSCSNLYPSGEGAGYAGGITSAAVDGLKSALKYLENL